MKITRRSFLKSLIALAFAEGIKIPAFAIGRQPYVNVGEVVNHIGPAPGGFIGGQIVKSVGSWDGVGYPVTVFDNGYPPREEHYYDVDLSCFRRELPDKFWWNPENEKYPNVHTWIRMQRFGETLREAIVKLNYASTDKFLAAI